MSSGRIEWLFASTATLANCLEQGQQLKGCIFYIRHRAARHAGRVRVNVPLSHWLVFRGAQTRGCFFFLGYSRSLFPHFLHLFSELIYLQRMVPTGLKMGASKLTKFTKNMLKLTIKTHPQSRPAKRLCLEGVKPLNLLIVTHFQLFFQRPGAPKRESKWEPKCTQNHKNQEKRALKKT